MWITLLAVLERIGGRWLPAATAPLSNRESFIRVTCLAFTAGVAVLVFALPAVTLGVAVYLLTDSILLTLSMLFVLVPTVTILLLLGVVVARCLRRGG